VVSQHYDPTKYPIARWQCLLPVLCSKRQTALVRVMSRCDLGYESWSLKTRFPEVPVTENCMILRSLVLTHCQRVCIAVLARDKNCHATCSAGWPQVYRGWPRCLAQFIGRAILTRWSSNLDQLMKLTDDRCCIARNRVSAPPIARAFMASLQYFPIILWEMSVEPSQATRSLLTRTTLTDMPAIAESRFTVWGKISK